MKTISKILSVVLCLAMVVGFFAFGASAAENTVTLTIPTVSESVSEPTLTTSDNAVTITAAKNTGNNAPIQHTSGQLRVYTDNSITFTPASGVTLTKIEITTDGANYRFDDEVAVTGGTLAVNEDAVTITVNSDATSVVVTNNKTTSGKLQLRFKTVKFTYTGTPSGSQGGGSATTPVIADGTYVISAEGKAMTALGKGYGYPASADITIASGKVSTLSTASMIFTITNVDGGVTVRDADGRYYGVGLKSDGTTWYNSFQAPDAVDGDNSVWTVVKNSDNTYTFTSKASGLTMCLSTFNSGASFGVYAADDTANVKSANLTLTSATSVTVLPSDPVSIKTVTDEATSGKYYKVTGVVTYLNGKNVYVQDSTGALCLYFSTAPSDLAVGDVITAMGTYTEFNGLKELTGVTEFTKVTDSTLKLDDLKKTVTIADLVASDNAKYMCTYVVINGATVVVDGDNTYLSDGTNKILWYKPVVSAAPANGDTVTEFKGAVGWYNGAQLANTAAADVTITPNSNDDDDNNETTGTTGSTEGTTESTTESTTEGTTTTGYFKVTNGKLTSGKYIIVVDSGYAAGVLDGTWVSAVQPTISGNQVVNPEGCIWTLTVDGSKVTLTDENGKTIYNNGKTNMIEDSTAWNWKYEDGKFYFYTTVEEGSNPRYFSSSPAESGANRFRAYYLTPEPDSYGNFYYAGVTLYKLSSAENADTADNSVVSATIAALLISAMSITALVLKKKGI